MSLGTMIQSLLGTIPGSNYGLVKTSINEAFRKIQDENVWSFQLKTGGWLTPSLLGGPNTSFLSPGTITVVPFTTTITGDAVATAAWTANVPYPPLLTQQQIRVPYFDIYNIIALGNNGTVASATVSTAGASQTPGTYTVPVLDPDTGAGGTVSITVDANGTVTKTPVLLNAGSNYTTPYITFSAGGTPATFAVTLIATLTIDRPWTAPPAQSSNYMIYQSLYPAPAGFKKWFYISDVQNNFGMDWWTKTESDLANDDPERTIFDQPYYVCAWGPDNRPGSATAGQMMYELWPSPISVLTYSFGCLCNYPPLVNNTDTIPYPLNDEIVKWRAREILCQWKEGMKGDNLERGSGANWQFLSKAAHEEYKELLKQARIMDSNLVSLYYTKSRQLPPFGGEPFSSPNGNTNIGLF